LKGPFRSKAPRDGMNQALCGLLYYVQWWAEGASSRTSANWFSLDLPERFPRMSPNLFIGSTPRARRDVQLISLGRCLLPSEEFVGGIPPSRCVPRERDRAARAFLAAFEGSCSLERGTTCASEHAAASQRRSGVAAAAPGPQQQRLGRSRSQPFRSPALHVLIPSKVRLTTVA
jgi:hypothetical protein